MSWSRAAYIFIALGKRLLSVRGGTALLSSFGALYTIVKLTDRFAPSLSPTIDGLGPLVGALGFGFAVWLCWPKLHTECTLHGRDIKIEIRIGDLFKTPGALIVATNTTFDTKIAPGMIDENSVQGQFTRRHFGTAEALDVYIDAALQREQKLAPILTQDLEGHRDGKRIRYPMGTAIRMEPKGTTAYMFAMADMNPHGTAQTTPNDVKDALSKLWLYIGERGTKSTLAIPVIASRFGQLTLTREQLIQIMIRSFVAACSERTFCEKLVIVISSRDAERYKIDMNSLEAYLQHICKYTNAEQDNTSATGTPVGISVTSSPSSVNAQGY